MPTPPRRRWFQFGIGTMLLLVTAAAFWVNWEMSLVQRRTAMRNWIEQNGGWVYEKCQGGTVPTFAHRIFMSDLPLDVAPSVSPWRRLLGDAPVFVIALPIDPSDGDLQRAQAMFPEVRAIYYVVARPEYDR